MREIGIYGITAESKENVEKMLEEISVSYAIFSDPEHKLRNYLAEQELVRVSVSGGENSKNEFYRNLKWFKPYKHGVAQPAVLFSTKEKRNVYAWSSQPCDVNLHGALSRPDPKNIWEEIQKKLAEASKS